MRAFAIIDLPWPSRWLHPNTRCHWAAKAKAAKHARADAHWAAKKAGIGRIDAPGLAVTAVVHAPDNRRRDLDGLLSSLKANFDGIADATGIDDSKWQIGIRRGENRRGGAISIEIEVTT